MTGSCAGGRGKPPEGLGGFQSILTIVQDWGVITYRLRVPASHIDLMFLSSVNMVKARISPEGESVLSASTAGSMYDPPIVFTFHR